MIKRESLQVGVAVAVVLAATLACKPKSGTKDAGGPTTTTTATPTVEATVEPSATAADTASAKPTATATTTAIIKPTTSATVAVAAGKSTYKVGDALTVTWKSSTYPATVLAVLPNDQYKIHYTGYESSWDETIGLDRIVKGAAAAPAAKADAGAAVATAKDAGAAAVAACAGATSTRCAAVCVNLQADDKNCGACAKVCGAGTHCTAGTCK